jgi:hypothetical protein
VIPMHDLPFLDRTAALEGDALCAEVADELFEGASFGVGSDLGDNTVLIGPVVPWPNGAEARRWYFLIASNSYGIMTADRLNAETKIEAEALRDSIKAALIELAPFNLVDYFDSNLAMAERAEALWPQIGPPWNFGGDPWKESFADLANDLDWETRH